MHALRHALVATAVLTSTMGSGAALAIADDRVTLVLRSGEKITGDLDGMVDNRIYVRTSFADQPKVPIDQIAVIDVGGDGNNLPEAEVNEARGAAHLLVPAGGGAVKGQFIRIEGSRGDKENPRPPEVAFRTEGGQARQMPLSEVRRIYLGNYPGAAPSTSTSSTAPAGAGERVITLPANVAWVDTGILVRQGDRVNVNASGEIVLSADPNDKAGVAGALSQRRAPGAPAPSLFAGALIGRIGAGRPFAIGNQPVIEMPAAGRLSIGVNDDNLADNTGNFEVRLRPDVVRSGSESRRRSR